MKEKKNMKKISIILMAVLTLGLTSCDLEQLPYNSIPDTEALQNPTDFANMRVGLYSSLRAMNSGDSFINATELMTDGFNGVVGWSNTLGLIHRWQVNAQDGTFETVYSNYQGLIARANFIIQGADKLEITEKGGFNQADSLSAILTVGESYFIRAYCLFNLAQFFCADYEAATASEPNSGVSYSLVYAPTSDASKYPGRYTLAQTYEQIKSDLVEARKRVYTKGGTSLGYVTDDVITALEARVALAMDDYATAAAKATELINNGRYMLAGDAESINSLWVSDGSGEAIWMIPTPSGTQNELSGQTGLRYQPYTAGSTPDFIPTQELIDIFSNKDMRFNTYFLKSTLTTTNGVTADVYTFNKYPDHTGIYEAQSGETYRFRYQPKVFRIAEMYLIAAEAFAKSGNLGQATLYLNELEANRIEDFQDRSYNSVDGLMTELKLERRRELLGEGMRLFDLKRWHEGFTRGTPQQINICVFPGSNATTAMKVDANNNRLVWPIPQSEMDSNPQMVQNPGY